jgi:predicted RNA binding protein YcfA (HicA-like mRNA interferase family)
MTRLPRIKGKDLIRALHRAGFVTDRMRGSHVFLKHRDGRATSVPVHAREILGPGLLRAILRDLEMSSEELGDLLR